MRTKGNRSRQWPRSTSSEIGRMRTTDEIAAQPLVVAESVRPSRLFMDLVAALGLPESVVRFIISDALDDPDITPETLTAPQLAHVGRTLLRAIDATLMDEPRPQRAAVHRRVEELLQALERERVHHSR